VRVRRVVKPGFPGVQGWRNRASWLWLVCLLKEVGSVAEIKEYRTKLGLIMATGVQEAARPENLVIWQNLQWLAACATLCSVTKARLEKSWGMLRG
jgi:hypothetical protein